MYAFAELLIRGGNKRFLGQSTAFVVIFGAILGSMLIRAGSGNSAFTLTLGAAAAFVALHWDAAFDSFRSDRFGSLVKGTPRRLVLDGKIRPAVVARSHISKQDLLQALLSKGGLEEISKVRLAYLERNGDNSVVTD